jgi:putative tryptophan/tyrosine transport system substrate-binding protein
VKRREFIAGLGAVTASSTVARAQRPARVIGLLGTPSRAGSAHEIAGFERGLGKAGYIEGRNVSIEQRWADDSIERLPMLAADLVRRNVDVIVAFPGRAALAAKAATGTVPIVFHTGGDPVKLGLVASFNRPGGNLTGVSQLASDLTAKRLGLLHNLLPRASLIGVLADPRGITMEDQLTSLRQTARELELRLVVSNVDVDRGDIESAFEGLAQARLDALLVAATSFLANHRAQIVGLAARHAIPAIYEDSYFVKAGGLVSYGTDFPAVFEQLGSYAGKILDGAKPGDLPVVQPTKFELVINLKTAKSLGLTIPETLLATADEVIQ